MTTRILSLVAAAALLATVPAIAQTTTPAAPATPAPAAAAPKVAIPSGVFFRGQTASQFLAKDRLIGAKVHDKDGKIIADIEDIIFNSSNEIEGVIMASAASSEPARRRSAFATPRSRSTARMAASTFLCRRRRRTSSPRSSPTSAPSRANR